MTPDQLAKTDTEHAHQRAFFAWLALAAYNGFEGAKIMAETGKPLPANHAEIAQAVAPMPELHLFHAIPNGGARDKITAAKLKAEGVKAGVLDTFLPVPKPYVVPAHVEALEGGAMVPEQTYWYMGLYVEFKEPNRKTHKEGGMSQAQIDFAEAVRAQGYCVRVAYSWREAANIVMAYYGVDVRFET